MTKAVLPMNISKKKRTLPFDLLIPNQRTIDAMEEARHNRLKLFKTVQSLMDDLNRKNY